ncbi:serine-rich adhesin for platelets-like isoform X2 [Ruditapes philippinarum]|uniref:serine-rich adhesin for platelets-like isoform X2 n=1 Tax=Ruditapes philippinarum TaxID=129788 RepID=UPI00295AC686|nr:serine-rich adhesin for platelets-like isoform X2 [Ruditapes philippinarum]
MPENPNIDPESGSNGFYNANVTMATTNNNRNNNRNQGIPRVSSAGIKYYDIATQLLGKNGSDLEELFIAAARDGVYEKIENFLHRNRSDYVISIDVKDKKTGNTPLIWAAKRGHAKIVQLLLRHGADITLRNYEGQTAVEVASPSIRSILLESVERSTEASHQLLLQAAWQGDIQVVSRLLSQKKVLDINCQNADGFTPVMLATRDMQLFEKLSSQMSRNYNPIEVVTELLAARADLHASDGDGKSCVHHASQSKAQIAQSVLTSIISGAPNLEQKDKRCFAPLHCASLTGNADCISALLDGGSDVNSRGFAGATALHITSYNNHEKATTVLLEHGANVTLTDDRGLTPLDFAKTRKMKKKLQEAWAEVKSSKSTTSLGPIRAHSREDLRSSVEDLTKKRKGKGEVIFEGLPNNPFTDSNKKDAMSNPKGITRHLSLKEKSRGEDEFSQSHLRDNVRKLGQVRNQQKPTPLPRTKSRSTERLPVISPDRVSSDRNLESPVMFGRNSRLRRSFEDRKNGRGRKVNPLTARESSNLTDDVFERFSPAPVSPTPSHRRSESDPNRGTPNLMELAASCEPYLHSQKRGRSYSVNSNPANDLEANRCTPNQREFTPFHREGTTTTLQREATLMSVCSYRTDSRMSTNSNSPRMLNLGQMLSKNKTPVQHLYGPGSSKVIPPTPTFITQRSDGKSESDISPRSDEDSEVSRDAPELVRSRTIYKDEFVLEESRPKDPFIRTPSTGSDTVSSSGSSHLSGSPRDTPLSVKGNQTRKSEKTNTVKPKQQTGNSANIVGSVKIGASKLNEKFASNANNRKTNNSVQNGSGLNSGDDSKVDNSVPKLKINNAVSAGNSKYGSILHTMAVRNAAAQNATKVNSSNTNGAKSGGKITVHGIHGVNDNDTDDKVAPSDKTVVTESTYETVDAGVKRNDNSKPDTKAAEIKTNAQVTNARKKASQKMQNVLQVVPTKLTQNIVRTAPKGSINTEKSATKTVSVKTADKVNTSTAPKQEVVSNVNMHLLQSAQVQSRVSPQDNNKTKLTETNNVADKNESAVVKKQNVGNSDQGAKKVESKNGQTNTDKNDNVQLKPADNLSGKNVSGPQSSLVSNKVVKQSTSADISNRQGAQSRNSTFNVSKSASVNQRQVGNVRKTTSSYTPRFPSNNLGKQKSTLSDKSEGKEDKQSANTANAAITTQTSTDTNASAPNKSQTTDNTTTVKTASSTSPTDLVSTTVSRSASIMKSYNMSGVPSTPKSSSSSSLTSDTSSTANKSIVSNMPSKKNQVLSKSMHEPLQKTSKISNASIVSSSVSQMPSVGTVTSDKSQSKGLLRSASMTTIDEAKEKKLMSSSDTKIQCATNSNNGRPSSDTPIGSAGTKNNHNNVTPLVEIMPECAPRINRKNYMDINNPMTTPVIVNPFEELEQKRALTATEFGFVVDKPSIERSKTQVSLKGKNAKSQKKTVNSSKPSSATTRGSSGKKKRSRSKDANKSDNESRPKSGKSGRRIRSAKRKRKIPAENLAKENEKPDVALIGGIGWQIATSCIDKSEADAVVVSQIDSSESDGEDVSIFRLASPVNFEMSDNELHIPNALDTPSSMYSPRFKEVRPPFENKHEEDLPMADNDGYRPMNLDMTQNSLSQNRAGVIIKQDMPGDISNFLSKLREDESDIFDDDNDIYDDEDDYGDEEDIEDMLHRQVVIGQLTPIPESPSLTNTNSTLKYVAKTVDAINRFDKNMKDEDLSKLLGTTPRDKVSASSDRSSANMGRSGPVRNCGGSLRSAASQKDSKQSSSGSAMSRSLPSRNSSSKTNMSRISNLSSEIREKASKVFGNSQLSPNSSAAIRDSNSRSNSVNKSRSNSLRKSSSREKLYTEKDYSQGSESKPVIESPRNDMNSETKERIDSKISDLKKMLADKMQKTQKLLNESTQNNSYKKRKQIDEDQDSSETCENDVKLNINELTEENLKAFDTSRTEDDMKSTRSSRKERRYSETKKVEEKDEDMKEAIDEILSNTFPSSRSNMKSVNSFKSGNSTLTEADRKVLKKMVQENQNHASPFHAKESVRVSSSYDDSVTLNKDNPELMKRFNAEKFEMGQRMKAMIDAGADQSKVKAMVKADNNEAKQLARIMNSFRQMELYAGPHSTNNNRSAKKETPRREGENMHKSLSRFDNPHSSHQLGIPPRPGSAGAGRMKPGKFTEIKGGKSASHVGERSNSPVNVPKNLADEFKRSPFREVSSLQEENINELANVIKITSQSSEDDHLSLEDDEIERADSACTTLSSQSSIMEETIQWKKGNVLGKGAFGTVWCGLTSEGQLIAVKQIELNTTNQNKAKKEYEKVQEEVELLKTLEHKNIVGYLGTSLEDSVVSIFMQFVPGGSIASILARFGALDEAVFRKYTKQILEGVEYLHANDVIHRDIKGGNVMLMPNGVIKLIDFGCAKRLCINLSMGQSQILKSMKGTPYWMAPEVVNETGHGKKSDIWSVGCTVFEMATRKPPWAEMNPMAAIFAIGSDKPVPQLPEKFTEEAKDFVNCCLTKDQAKRLSATQLLQTTFMKRRSKKSSSTC